MMAEKDELCVLVRRKWNLSLPRFDTCSCPLPCCCADGSTNVGGTVDGLPKEKGELVLAGGGLVEVGSPNLKPENWNGAVAVVELVDEVAGG
jgi:hypothetical protein